MSTTALPAHLVRAYNTAATSENKIHDDAVAQKFGFTGALVPGVEVYAYMAHMPVARWGRAWLEGGDADCRFLKPVYADDTIYPALEVIELKPGRTTGVVTLRSTVFNQRRELVLEGMQKFLIRRRQAGA